MSRWLFAYLLTLPVLVGFLGRGTATAKGGAASKGTMNAIEAVAFSPDGKLVAGGSWDGTVRLYDAETGELDRTLRGPGGPVVSVAFSPNGSLLACGDAERVVLRDTRTGKFWRTLDRPGMHRLNALAYSHDGKTVAVGDQAGRITLWDPKSASIRRELDGDGLPVHGVAFSPDDAILAVAGGDKTLKLWDVAAGQLRRALWHGGIVWSVAFSADGNVATACEDGKIRLWDARAGECRRTLSEGQLPLRFVAASPDGSTVAAMTDSELKLWDARTGAPLGAPTEGVSFLRSLAFSPDGRRLVGGGGTQAIGAVRVWDVRTGGVRWEDSGQLQRVLSVSFSPDGGLIAGGIGGYWQVHGQNVEAGYVKLWDAATGNTERTVARPAPESLSGTGNWVLTVAFGPDGKTVAIGRADHTIQLWNREAGGRTPIWRGPDAVSSVAFSPDGKAVASGHRGTSQRGGEVILWDVGTGIPRWSQAVPRSSVTSLAFSPDGASIAVGSVEHKHGVGGPSAVRLLDARSGRLERSLVGGPQGARALAFSPDGAALAGAFPIGPVHVWDVRAGTLRGTLEGHRPGRVVALAFASDGATIASASLRDRVQLERPGEVKVFDTRTGAEKRALTTDAEPASSAVFAPDLSALAIGRDDGTVTRFPLSE